MSGRRPWLTVAPIAVAATGLLALVAVTVQGPRLRTDPAPDTSSRHAAVQASIDGLLARAPITFAPNSTEPMTSVLPRLAEILRDAPAELSFEIGGHAAAGPGDAATAKALSQSRADAVTNALVNSGVPAQRLVSTGYGDSRPAGGDDRRVDVTVR